MSMLSIYHVNPPLVLAIDQGLNNPEAWESISASEQRIIQYVAGNDAHLLDQFTDVYSQVRVIEDA